MFDTTLDPGAQLLGEPAACSEDSATSGSVGQTTQQCRQRSRSAAKHGILRDETDLVVEGIEDIEGRLPPWPLGDFTKRAHSGRRARREPSADSLRKSIGFLDVEYGDIDSFRVRGRAPSVTVRLGIEARQDRSLAVEIVSAGRDANSGNGEDVLVEASRFFYIGYGYEYAVEVRHGLAL